MSEKQAEVMQEALTAVTKALQAGIDPDVVMDRIIRTAIEVTKHQSTS
jgi:hypothetical protein